MEQLAGGNHPNPAPSPVLDLADRLVAPHPDLLLISPNPNPNLQYSEPIPIPGSIPDTKPTEELDFGQENSLIDSDSDIDIDSDGSEGRVTKGSLAGSDFDSGRSSPLSVSSDSNEQLEDVNEWEGLTAAYTESYFRALLRSSSCVCVNRVPKQERGSLG